jgi:SAM-dependent methyltransferase
MRADASLAAEFDAFAADYEAALQLGLRASGEEPEYFARRRIRWSLSVLTSALPGQPAILDYGCGVGIATGLLRQACGAASIWGYDPSSAAIARARREHGRSGASFCDDLDDLPSAAFDVAYCNGVFHHIPLADRPAALAAIRAALRPGGWFAFWENNPWNPGTRYVMSRIPFDRDAITLSPIEARRLLRESGFDVTRTDSWFIFPRTLSWLRPLESLVHRLPLGGQYMVLAQKPRSLR